MTVDAGKENDMAKKNIKMKRAAAVVLMLAALLSGCAGKHIIRCVSGEQFVVSCPRSAKPGETVRIETVLVNDADLYVNPTDDTEIRMVKDGLYEFEMPDHDFEFKITVISNGLA